MHLQKYIEGIQADHIEGYKPSGLQYIVHITHKMNLGDTISSKDTKLNVTSKYMISQMQKYISKPSIILP